MRNLTLTKLLYLIPSNYKGLNDKELQVSIRKHSTIDLSEPVLLEDLEIVIERYSKPELLPSLTLFYFGKDIETNRLDTRLSKEQVAEMILPYDEHEMVAEVA